MELEQQGIPTVTICTHEFAYLGQTEARALGMPGLPLLVVPHPLGGTSPQEARAKADLVVEEVVSALTTPPKQLLREYRGRYTRSQAILKYKPLFG